MTADQVVVAAEPGHGELLCAMKLSALPAISERLGDLTRTNSEALSGATTARVPRGWT